MKLLNGLNTDVAHVDQPGGTYRRARNMILDDLAGAIANEDGPKTLWPDNNEGDQDAFRNYEFIGQFKVPGDRVVFAMKGRPVIGDNVVDTTKEEVIMELLPDESWTRLAYGAAGTFDWNVETPIQGVGYVNAAGQLILAWTDGRSKPKYVNTATWANDPSVNLIFPEAAFPMTRPVAESAYNTSGSVLGGTWTFMLAYEVTAGTNNITQYGPAIGSFRIGNTTTNENATYDTAIGLKFYGLDTNYEYVRVYGVRTFNGVETVHYCDRVRITDTDLEWTYLGQAESEVDVPASDELFIPKANYLTAQTLTSSDDRLFMGNMSAATISETDGLTIANGIHMKWGIDKSASSAGDYDKVQNAQSPGRVRDYTNAYWVDTVQNRSDDNVAATTRRPIYWDSHGLMGGFMPNEVYAFYIAFLMKDGTWSQAFHIPGGGDDGDFSSAARLDTATVSAETVQIYNDGVDTYDLRLSGSLGYTVNSNEDYPSGYTAGVTAGTLSATGVRHHLMPSPEQLWSATSTSDGGHDSLDASAYRTEWCNQNLGVYAQNVIIDADTADKIQGFKIFYAKANINERRVKAYAPAWAWHPWANLTAADTNYASRVDQNFLRIYDPFLLANKPVIDGWKVTEVYKGMHYTEQLSYLMKTSNLDGYAYMPANTQTDTFDNRFRETCLALDLTSTPGYDEGWDAGWPGIRPGTSVNESVILSMTSSPVGWNGQVAYDGINPFYPTQNPTDSAIGDNFASVFGSFQKRFSGTYSALTLDDKADKTLTSFSYTPQRGTSTFYNPYTAAATGAAPGNNGYAGWGNMRSFIMLSEEKSDWFENYADQELVETNVLTFVDGAATYESKETIFGGDTFITPVVVEFMNSTSGMDPTPIDVNDEAFFDRIAKDSYFTWSHVCIEHQDRAEDATWQDLYEYSEVDENYFYGDFLNNYTFGDHHYRNNDWKASFPHKSDSLIVSELPNRIIRSAKQNYESTKFAWSSFAYGDYYDNALGKESIRNLEDFKGELIIHHGNAIFKTRSKFNFDASGTNVYVGTGDIFQAPPVELFSDVAGYAGLTHWSDSLMCRPGYVWVDRDGRKVFMLSDALNEISAKGLRDYFRDDFCVLDTSGFRDFDAISDVPTIHNHEWGGFTLGFDPKTDRILLTKKFCSGFQDLAAGAYFSTTTDGETLSYSLRNQCWASMHDYKPYQYLQSYNKLYMFDESAWLGVVTAAKEDNLSMVFEIGGDVPGTLPTGTTVDGSSTMPSFVDVVFNMGGEMAKVWQNFNWVTKTSRVEGTEDLSLTFDEAQVYNNTQISQVSTNFRRTDNQWQFNEFRDDSTGSGTFFTDNAPHSLGVGRIDASKNWYNRGRFISEFAILRLKALNSNGDKLYLTDVNATARRARR